jgi:hypothetical protein
MWNKAKRNLEQFRDNTPLNINYHVNCCIIPLNVYYVDELGDYLQNNFSHARNGNRVSYNFIRGEGALDIAKTPMGLREQVWKKIGEDHVVSKVLKEVPVLDYGDMLGHLSFWDPIRKLDWQKTFPDIVEYFK